MVVGEENPGRSGNGLLVWLASDSRVISVLQAICLYEPGTRARVSSYTARSCSVLMCVIILLQLVCTRSVMR